ncbi:uncharacterized protein [Fopius arisanus]|uniref:Uncharacterized protein n=1 Tax=Fopius arisanus TaxID=64838 RepID=A0A9R1T726_9HYME|nr:PREDICTED: uncharacterized protein LOC105267000 [Fopius arisanus]
MSSPHESKISKNNAFRKALFFLKESREILRKRYSIMYCFETNYTEEQRKRKVDAIENEKQTTILDENQRELNKKQRLAKAAKMKKIWQNKYDEKIKEQMNNQKEGQNEHQNEVTN